MDTPKPTGPAIEFICPICHRDLEKSATELVCPPCNARYPVVDGIPCFFTVDKFYESRWVQPDLTSGSLRNRLVKKERFFLNMLRGKQGSLLDLGCGGGWRMFSQVGATVGVDVSIGSLKAARTLYDVVVQSGLTCLPFPDNTFDYVVSTDVLGHIPLEEKDLVLSEIKRILRPGGITLHYVEAEGDDPLMKFARSHPELYRQHILDPEGHIGLEAAGAIFRRFRRQHWEPIEERAVYRGPVYIQRFVQYFDNGYRRKSVCISALTSISKVIITIAPIALLVNLGITLVLEATDRICPESWAGGVLVCYQKKEGINGIA